MAMSKKELLQKFEALGIQVNAGHFRPSDTEKELFTELFNRLESANVTHVVPGLVRVGPKNDAV